MSTLEKTIHLLQKAPEHTIETVFAYLQSVLEQQSRSVASSTAFGIAHQYANPALMEREKEAFQRAMVEKHEVN